MNFTRPDGLELRIDVISYEDPDPDNRSDWLIIRYFVHAPNIGTWRKNDASIEVADLLEIKKWIHRSCIAVDFIEPNLRLEFIDLESGSLARVVLSAESKPPWVLEEESYFDFPVEQLDWQSFREDIDRWIHEFSRRSNTRY